MKNKLNNDLLVVRKINKEIYKKFKQKALEENKNIGEALNEAMICWLSTRRVANGLLTNLILYPELPNFYHH